MRSFEKLKQNYEFHRAYNRGDSYVAPEFVLYIVKGRREKIRLGITVSRKLGTAVARNRAKRVLTAAFDMAKEYTVPGYDYVIVARSRVLAKKSTAIAEKLCRILSDAGIKR
ncbi:MAG: ribonuclease P protein component [Clostridia bacterium]|nr:ribonuclease P protein component [Clostridia bacterium]